MAKVTKLKTKREHLDSVVSSIAESRHEQKYTDVTILCKGKKVPAHRILLHAGSPYFRKIFENEDEHDRQNVIEVCGVDPEIIDDVISFLYTGNIKTWYEDSFRSLKSILQAALLFEVTGLASFCWSEIVRTLKVDSFLDQWETAVTFDNKEVANQIAEFVGNNLRTITQSAEFSQLSCVQLKNVLLITEPKESCTSSDWIMQAILQWIKFDEAYRKNDLALLVGLIDMDSLSGTYLAHVLNCENLLTNEDNNFNQLFSVATTRLVDMEKEYYDRKLFASIGKKNGDDVIVLYDFDKKSWSAPTLLPLVVTSGAAVISFNGWLYFIGGYEIPTSGSVAVNKYNPRTSAVVSVFNMEVATSQAGTAVLHDMIYVVGGVSDNKAVNCVQRYDPETNSWSCVASTNQPHVLPSVVVVYDEMYVAGSYCCPAVESYDWNSDQWTKITQIPLPLTEQWPRATAHLDKLWVWRDLTEQKFIIYDPVKMDWEERDYSDGPKSVYGMWSTCTAVQQLDFIFVGASGLAYYTYHSETCTWTKLPPCPATDCYYWQSAIVV